ncbi:MAG TPA: hypothetical protein PKJ99_02775 [Thermoanaerobaculales bacterium]|nr:hypothetical protein [Thermoanaerobaculales bacterium]HQL29837.1 hypothetical protein [Thermoanaerobaculales bacterium]
MADPPNRLAYYGRLSAKNKAIYRRGDAIVTVALPDAPGLRTELRAAAAAAAAALAAGSPSRVRGQAQRICDLVTGGLGAERVTVKVLRVRPQRSDGELHGLYTRDDGKEPTLRVWMRTAQRADIVKPRTFLRTLVHELCHHLDYAHFKLGESFHNPGFFKRESSLMRLLADPAGDPATDSAPPPADHPAGPGPGPAPDHPVQLRLPEL